MDLRKPEERLLEEMESSKSDNFINFVISNNPDSELIESVFTGEKFTCLPETSDMFDVLVNAGCFKSKSQARQNWTKTDRDIDFGICSFLVGKTKLSLTIFKPIDTQYSHEVQ